MLCIGRDDPAVDPVGGSLFGKHILQIKFRTLFLCGILNIKEITGVEHGSSCLAVNHLVPYLVDYIGLNQGLLLNEHISGLSQLIRVCGIQRVALDL